VYLGLGTRWAVRCIVCRLDSEKQIQISEITHDALTNRRMAVRIRSPLSPAATQNAFRLTSRQTATVNNVEADILENFLAKEKSAPDGRVSSEESRRFLAVFVNNRNSILTMETHRVDHRPKSLPKNRDPMYSNCHSGQGGIN
jgi:hypothetical protein